MAIPQPLGHFSRAVYSARTVVVHGLPLFFGVHLTQCLRVAPADNEDVTWFECNALAFGDGFDVCDVDAEAGEGRIGDVVVFGVGFEVDQDASSCEAAASVPVCMYQTNTKFRFFGYQIENIRSRVGSVEAESSESAAVVGLAPLYARPVGKC